MMAAELFDTLVRLTLGISAALLAVLVARRVLHRRFGAQVAYAAWLVVPLVAAGLLLPARVAPPASASLAGTAVLAPVPVAGAPLFDPHPWLLAAWLAGVVVTAAGFALRQRRYLRSLGRLQPWPGRQALQSDSVRAGPALVGAWRPRIVLPADFEQRYDACEQALILAHEEIHRERGDARVNACVVALQALGWFNPLVHYAAGRFRLDQELACDAAVIARFPDARRSYANAMLKVQLAGQVWHEPRLPVGCTWLSNQDLKERIMMLKRPSPARPARRTGWLLVAVAGLAGAITAWASQAPRVPASTQTGVGAKPRIETSLRMDVGGTPGNPVHGAHPAGVAFTIADGPRRGEFVATAVAVDRISLQGSIFEHGRLLASPQVTARPGEPFAMTVEGRGGAAVGLQGTLAYASPAPHLTAAADVGHGGAPPAAFTPPGYRTLTPVPYPEAAIAAREAGQITLDVRVAEDGSVREVRLQHAPEGISPALIETAIQAVRAWTFNPARRDGRPVEDTVTVPIAFALGEDAAPGPGEAGAGLDTITVRDGTGD